MTPFSPTILITLIPMPNLVHSLRQSIQTNPDHTFFSAGIRSMFPFSSRNIWTCVTCPLNLRGAILFSNISSISAGVRQAISGRKKYPTTQEIAPAAPKLVKSAIHCTMEVNNRSINLQVSRLHTPNIEHERYSVVENQPKTK